MDTDLISEISRTTKLRLKLSIRKPDVWSDCLKALALAITLTLPFAIARGADFVPWCCLSVAAICSCVGFLIDMIEEAECKRSISLLKEAVPADFEHDSLSNRIIKRGMMLSPSKLGGKKYLRCRFKGFNFGSADLSNTTFTDCELQNADLSHTSHLTAVAFPGSNLTGASMPVELKKFKQLDNVEDLSKNAGKILIAILSAATYLVITAFATKSSDLVTDNGYATLPILSVSVPIRWIFTAGPVIILGSYVYLHLYLQRLWESLQTLPAWFPDGRMLDDTSYPWLVSDYVVTFLPLTRNAKNRYAAAQRTVYYGTALVLPPAAMALMLWRYLSTRDLRWEIIYAALVWVAIALGGVFALIARITLMGPRLDEGSKRKPWVSVLLLHTVRLMSFGLILAGLVSTSYLGKELYFHDRARTSLKSTLGDLVQYIHSETLPDFSYQDLTKHLASWDPKAPSSKIIPPTFSEVRLEGAKFQHAFCPAASFVGGSLRDANLSGTDLNHALFDKVDLTQASLESANLAGALIAADRIGDTSFQDSNLDASTIDGKDSAMDPKHPTVLCRGATLHGTTFKSFSGRFRLDLGNGPNEIAALGFPPTADLSGTGLSPTPDNEPVREAHRLNAQPKSTDVSLEGLSKVIIILSARHFVNFVLDNSSSCNLHVASVRFDNSTFSNVTCACRLNDAVLAGVSLNSFWINSRGQWDNFDLYKARIQYSTFANCGFKSGIFRNCTFASGTRFTRNCRFVDVTFIGCHYDDSCSIINCTFTGCVLDGETLARIGNECTLNQCQFPPHWRLPKSWRRAAGGDEYYTGTRKKTTSVRAKAMQPEQTKGQISYHG